MTTTIIAAILDGTPQFTASKPSDMLGIAVMGGLFCLPCGFVLPLGKILRSS